MATRKPRNKEHKRSTTISISVSPAELKVIRKGLSKLLRMSLPNIPRTVSSWGRKLLLESAHDILENWQ